jgi:hypothetical protein
MQPGGNGASNLPTAMGQYTPRYPSEATPVHGRLWGSLFISTLQFVYNPHNLALHHPQERIDLQCFAPTFTSFGLNLLSLSGPVLHDGKRWISYPFCFAFDLHSNEESNIFQDFSIQFQPATSRTFVRIHIDICSSERVSTKHTTRTTIKKVIPWYYSFNLICSFEQSF